MTVSTQHRVMCTLLKKEKTCTVFYRVIQTRVEVWENGKCCGNTSRRRVFPQLFRVLPNFHECVYNSIKTRRTCFLFLLENLVTKERKTCKLDYQNEDSQCSRHHYINKRVLILSPSSYTNMILTNQRA